MSVSLAELIGEKNRVEELGGSTQERVLAELLERLVENGVLEADAVVQITRQIIARERVATTGIGQGVATPHLKECTHVQEPTVVFGRSRGGVDYAATDGEPCHIFFLVLTPPGAAAEHLQIMKRVALLVRDRKTLVFLTLGDNFDQLTGILQEIDEQA